MLALFSDRHMKGRKHCWPQPQGRCQVKAWMAMRQGKWATQVRQALWAQRLRRHHRKRVPPKQVRHWSRL
jgi:hypothetical protein